MAIQSYFPKSGKTTGYLIDHVFRKRKTVGLVRDLLVLLYVKVYGADNDLTWVLVNSQRL